MAFQQPQQRRPRPTSISGPPVTTVSPTLRPAVEQQEVEEPREWVLFVPDDHSASQEHTEETPRTIGKSRLSDLGSLATAPPSDRAHDVEHEGNDDDYTEDLDSLDDGLHAFHEPNKALGESGDTVLPGHDGLGTFPGSSSPVQEQIWQHERYNPRRRRNSLRKENLQKKAEALQEQQQDKIKEEDRFQRIEKWRVEQSRAILEEIQKETRRRKRRSTSTPISDTIGKSQSISREPSLSPPPMHSELVEIPANEQVSWWQRFTRKVIRDIMGFDDATLSFIFGEAYETQPEEQTTRVEDAASALVDHAEQTLREDRQLTRQSDSWEDKLLSRIAKELGYLINAISTHPGAFSTYLTQQEQYPYAGMPAVLPTDSQDTRMRSPQRRKVATGQPAEPHFAPTLGRHQRRQRRRESFHATDPFLWGIEEEDEGEAEESAQAAKAENIRLQREREYWERDLDAKMVFGFLKSRLSPSSSQPAQDPFVSPPTRSYHPRSSTHPDSLRRAALIRHHHPLVSRTFSSSLRASGQVGTPNASTPVSAPLSPILGRRPSSCADRDTESCASQSTKRSKTAHTHSAGSSRNYWDIGAGSVGSASAWNGDVGWGEV